MDRNVINGVASGGGAAEAMQSTVGTTLGTGASTDQQKTPDLALMAQYAAAGFATTPDLGSGTVIASTPMPGGTDQNFLTNPQH